MNREKKLALNSISSLCFQLTTIICGFVLPRQILAAFGSNVNGLVNSITQFIAVVGFLELGVGTVVQSSLYKPLAENDDEMISKVLKSAEKFFKTLAIILLIYIIGLIVIYPIFVKKEFDFLFTATLIASMSISSFSQYYFGIIDRLLLNADQRGYIQYNSQTITVILNTIACVILIKLNASIQLVKLATSIIYTVRPFVIRRYINKHYNINRKISYKEEPIKQKWNGVAQHVAAVILDGTDTIVLTLFSSLQNVSIYSVYHLVVYGVKTLFTSLTNGVQALLGELWARQEIAELKKTFGWAEWAIHTGVTFVFGCTASLIVPFIQVYTNGINDANYNVPLFALLITLANAVHCIRLPYNIMILAAGHYKQTQSNYIVAALLNIFVSVVTVKFWGLIGVAIGTLLAMLYQTIWMAWYDSKVFFHESLMAFLKHIIIDLTVFICSFSVCKIFNIISFSYAAWIMLAIKDVFIWGSITIAINYVMFPEYTKKAFHKIVLKRTGE